MSAFSESPDNVSAHQPESILRPKLERQLTQNFKIVDGKVIHIPNEKVITEKWIMK